MNTIRSASFRFVSFRLVYFLFARKLNRLKTTVFAWWCNGYGFGSVDLRLKGRRFESRLSGSNLGQVVHTRVPLSPSSIIWYRSRGGDAPQLGSLASHWPCVTDFNGLSCTYGLTAKRDEHPAYTARWLMAHFTFTFSFKRVASLVTLGGATSTTVPPAAAAAAAGAGSDAWRTAPVFGIDRDSVSVA